MAVGDLQSWAGEQQELLSIPFLFLLCKAQLGLYPHWGSFGIQLELLRSNSIQMEIKLTNIHLCLKINLSHHQEIAETNHKAKPDLSKIRVTLVPDTLVLFSAHQSNCVTCAMCVNCAICVTRGINAIYATCASRFICCLSKFRS